MPQPSLSSFYNIYSTFSSSQIRILQFAFRVILQSEQTNSALLQIDVKHFFDQYFSDLDDLIHQSYKTTPPSVATGYLDLHEWITLIYHIKNNTNAKIANTIVPNILKSVRDMQHRRTEVPMGEPVASESQLRSAKYEAEKEEAKNNAVKTGSILGLKPYYKEMFDKYEQYWNTTKQTKNSTLTSSNPIEALLDHATIIRLLDAGFWHYSISVDEEIEKLVELRTLNRKNENIARVKYSDEFSQEELSKFIRQFRDMDDDDSGTIDTDEIGQAFALAGIDIDRETLIEVVEEADADHSGTVDIDEWIGIQKAVRDGTSKAMQLLAEAARKNADAKEADRVALQFKRSNASAARSAILKKFPPQRLAMFRKTFDAFDADKSGEVDLEELVAMCQAMDMNVPKRTLRKLMDQVDADGSGEIDFVEFVEMMDLGKKGALSNVFYNLAHKRSMLAEDKRKEVLKKQQLLLKARMKEIEKKQLKSKMRAEAKKKLSKLELAAIKKSFAIIDVDEDGSLDPDELKDAFKALGLKTTKKEIRKMFKKVDIDGDGSLDVDEYIICVAACKGSAKHGKAFRKLAESANNLAKNNQARLQLEKKKQSIINKRQKEIQASNNLAMERAAIRKKFPKAQLVRLRIQFNVVDADGSGELDEGELLDLFRSMNIKPQPKKKQIRKIFKEIDDDDSGTIDFEEFLNLFNKIKEAQSGFLAEARKRVERAATSGDGGLGMDMNALQQKALERKTKKLEIRAKLNEKATERAALFKVFSKKELEHLRELFDRLDSDKSGTIDRDEMRQGLMEGDVRLTDEELDAALNDIDEDGDGELDWVEFVSMCKGIQEGKESTGGRLIMSLAEKKMKSVALRRKAKEDAYLEQRSTMSTTMIAKEMRATENRGKFLSQRSKEREKKAVSRMERQEEARRRREAQIK